MPNPKGGINAQKVDENTAYLRAQYRGQDLAKDVEDPQPGPLEDRSRTADRKAQPRQA